MIIEEFEINFWGKWRRDDTGDSYSFVPGQYDNENFKDFQTGLLVSADKKKTFKIGFKIYQENNKAMLQIVDSVYEIKRIDRRTKPATMVLLDSLNKEINFTEEK